MLEGLFPGIWWRTEDPDNQITGILTLGYDEFSLELIGAFGGLQEMGRVQAYAVLHGISTSGLSVTLINSLVAEEGFTFGASGVPRSLLRPTWGLIGGHVDDPVRATWRHCVVELERMTAWASPKGLGQSIEVTDERRLKGAILRYEPPAPVEVQIPGAALSIGPAQSITGDLVHEARITVSAKALLAFDGPMTVEEIGARFLRPLSNLMILATQKPTSILSFEIASDPPAESEASRTSSVGPPSSPDAALTWLEVVGRRAAPADWEHRRLLPSEALFLLPDLLAASSDALSLWYAAAAQLERAIDLVSAIRGSTNLFVDHRFLNVAIAAESYHEERLDGRAMSKEAWSTIVEAATQAAETPELGEQVRSRMATMNMPSLRQRVQELIDAGGDSLKSLLPDPDGVAKRASKVRNDLSHGGSISERNLEIFNTTDELLLVLEFHFLTEAGFSREEAGARLRAASRSYSGLWLRHQSA